MNTEVINPETGEILDASKPKLSKKERYLVRLAELLEEAKVIGLKEKEIDQVVLQIEKSSTDDELVLIGKNLNETIKNFKEAKEKQLLEPVRLYQMRIKKKEDGTKEAYKDYTNSLPALEECRQTKTCQRIRLNCPLFPLANGKGELSGVCSERLDMDYKQFDQKQGAW